MQRNFRVLFLFIAGQKICDGTYVRKIVHYGGEDMLAMESKVQLERGEAAVRSLSEENEDE